MPAKSVSEFKAGEEVDIVLQVREASRGTTKRGSPYMRLILADRTGSIEARKWDCSDEDMSLFAPGARVRVKGAIESYNQRNQIKIANARAAAPEEVRPGQLQQTTSYDVEELKAELLRLAKTVKDKDLLGLLKAFLSDGELMERFSKAPGAVLYHHAYVGGLLEHTVWVTRQAEAIASVNPRLRRDLLIAGAVLHDLGKMYELAVEPMIDRTDAGYLIGHIVLGAIAVAEKIRSLCSFPPDLKLELLHLVLSHHGEQQYGSPVSPATPEALALHHIDNLDAKVQAADAAIEAPAAPGARWTDYSKMLGVRLFRGNRGEAGGSSG